MNSFHAALVLAFTLALSACQTRAGHGSASPRIAAKILKLSRVNVFGGSTEKGYFFKVDLDQKTLEGNWTELDAKSKEFVSMESSTNLNDVQIAAIKKDIAGLKEVEESNDCDKENPVTLNILLSDEDEDLLFEAVGPDDAHCGGPFVDKAGYLRLQKELDSWLPTDKRKQAAAAVDNDELLPPKK